MKPKKQFRPQDLRSLLTTILIIVLVGSGITFNWGLSVIREYATDVDHRLADADASGKQIEELQTLKTQLTQSNSLVDKANQLFVAPASYQSQALSDVKNYADATGLSIANTSFDTSEETGTHTMTLSLNQPVSYSKLIAFLNNIESNLPKLQVSSISLGKADSNADSVRTGEIKIDVSVR